MSLSKHKSTEGATDDWITPKWVVKPLGKFDLDPCASQQQPWRCAQHNWTRRGLILPWKGRVWLNPPFNRYQRPRWMERMAEHNNGIMLIPAAMETKAFRTYVFGIASGICALKERPHFCYPNGTTAPFNSGATFLLVAYGFSNLVALQRSKLGTVLLEL